MKINNFLSSLAIYCAILIYVGSLHVRLNDCDVDVMIRKVNPLVERLQAKDIIQADLGLHFATYTYMKPTSVLHDHDFYEIVLIADGAVDHDINGMHERLVKGSLVLIRPLDQHRYENQENELCKMHNLAFTIETMKSIFTFLIDVLPQQLLEQKMPSIVHLTTDETYRISRLLERTFMKLDASPLSLVARVRLLLADVFIRHFAKLQQEEDSSEAPDWLVILYQSMKVKDNFLGGLSQLYALTSKSPAYICRMTRTYYHQTPTEKINALKLDYARKLLIHSDDDILTIAMESGFHNTSHFYHLFKKQYGCPPLKYRNKSQRTTLP
jgi:AraC family cel operon transcriptional repressor